jgi:ABC-type sugar transport system substrate-binding protein
MRAVVARVLTGAALGAVLAAPAFAAPPAKLSPSDIQNTFFNGQPFTASTPSNLKFKMTFAADGKMKRQPVGTGSKGEGTWRLSKDGFCTAWKGGKDSCFTVVSAGANKWSVLKGSTVMATWSK